MKKNFKLLHPRQTSVGILKVLILASICLIFALYVEFTADNVYAYHPDFCTVCGVVEDAPKYGTQEHMTMFANQYGEGWQELY